MTARNQSVELHVPTIRVRDDAHAFVRRLRGEIGASFCVDCGERKGHPNHAIAPKRTHPSMVVSPRTTCVECGAPVSHTFVKRCRPCNQAGIARAAAKRKAIYEQSRRSARGFQMTLPLLIFASQLAGGLG